MIFCVVPIQMAQYIYNVCIEWVNLADCLSFFLFVDMYGFAGFYDRCRLIFRISCGADGESA